MALIDIVHAWVQDLVKTVPDEKGLVPHLFNVEKWTGYLYEKRYHETAPDFLKVAAILHDIDRAHPAREVHRKDYPDYEQYKRAHSRTSTEIARAFLIQNGADEHFVEKVVDIISNHEFGGDKYSDIVVNADSISFFTDNINTYLYDKGIEKTKDKIRFMYFRMAPDARLIVKELKFDASQQLLFDLVVNE